MLYVQLDTNWPDDPKIIAAGIEGAGLHAVALCIAKRLNTNGWIARPLLYRQGATDDLIDFLVSLDLLEAMGDDVRPHAWLKRNPSQAAIAAKRAAKKRAARLGNHTRWDHPGEFDDCSICNPETPGESQLRSHSDPSGSESDRLSSPKTETETESKTEAAASDPTEPDLTGPALTVEQRRQRIMEAARQVAEERAIGRNDIGPGWIPGAARGIASDHHQALHAYLVKNPEATVLELIEQVIDAAGRTPKATGGVVVDADGITLPGSGRVSYFRLEDQWRSPEDAA